MHQPGRGQVFRDRSKICEIAEKHGNYSFLAAQFEHVGIGNKSVNHLLRNISGESVPDERALFSNRQFDGGHQSKEKNENTAPHRNNWDQVKMNELKPGESDDSCRNGHAAPIECPGRSQGCGKPKYGASQPYEHQHALGSPFIIKTVGEHSIEQRCMDKNERLITRKRSLAEVG